jgi:hypothetical protein
MTWDDAERFEEGCYAALAVALGAGMAAIEEGVVWLGSLAAMYGIVALSVAGWGVDRVRRRWRGS